MDYHVNLKLEVQNRLSRIRGTGYNGYCKELKYFLKMIQDTPYLQAITDELIAMHPEIQWPSSKEKYFHGRYFERPDEETAWFKICYEFIKEAAESKDILQALGDYYMAISAGGSLDRTCSDFTDKIVTPFARYLTDRVNNGSNALALLLKYKRKVEWFTRRQLFEAIKSEIERKTRKYEVLADMNLREYLFDQGVDYPFSAPNSPTGRADVIADIGDENLLALEIKLFDPALDYDRAHIKKGFGQVCKYMNDFGTPIGYLVIFNLTPKTIVFNTDIGNEIGRAHV